MTTAQQAEPAILPEKIARRLVLPEGHADLSALYDAYKWMRNNMPVAKAIVEGYDPIWLVTKHADIQEVESLSEVFAAGGGTENPGSHNPILQNTAGDEFTKQLLGGSLRILDALPYIDPPEHTHAKNMAFGYFKPPSVKKLEDQIRILAKESIEHLKHVSARGEIDLLDDWALGFPLHVMMTLLGVPPEDEPRMMALTQEFFGTADPEHQREDVEALSPGGDGPTVRGHHPGLLRLLRHLGRRPPRQSSRRLGHGSRLRQDCRRRVLAQVLRLRVVYGHLHRRSRHHLSNPRRHASSTGRTPRRAGAGKSGPEFGTRPHPGGLAVRGTGQTLHARRAEGLHVARTDHQSR